MKKSKQETAETREHIVEIAAAEFRKNGIGNTGLSDLMGAAGLTHGGFYRHFDSKDQLVAEACTLAAASVANSVTGATAGKSGHSALKAAGAKYLSEAHRDKPERGCPLAALGSEIVHCDDDVRTAAAAGFVALVDGIAEQLDDAKPAAAKRRALAAVTMMIGAMTMARVVPDKNLSSEILRQTREQLARM